MRWAVILLGVAGCSAQEYERQADVSARRILDPSMEQLRQHREDTVRYPDSDPEKSIAPATTVTRTGPGETLVLDLGASLDTAFSTNRDFITEKERIYLTALDYVTTRNGFRPQIDAMIDYAFSGGKDLDTTHSGGMGLGISQVFPWGGSISLDAQSGILNTPTTLLEPISYQSSLSLSVSQPLLRDSGRLVTLEPLRQAERNVIYALRDFELFRQDFAINVAERYYNLIQQQQSIENFRRNLESFSRLEAQAQALFEVGRQDRREVLRARRNALIGRNDLIAAVEDYQLAVDQFKIFLGLSTDLNLVIEAEDPPDIPVFFDLDSALEVALENRLDYITEQDRLVDVDRRVRIAKNGLLPDLDVNLNGTLDSFAVPRFGDQNLDRDIYSAAVSLSLPINRVNERNALRSAQVAQTRAKRNFERFEDNLIVDIKSSFRELRRRRQSVDIQYTRIEDERLNLRKAEIDFEAGDVENREVVEAQQSLTVAQNSLIREQVNYEVARLRLLRELGILFIDENGMWRE